MGFAYFGPCRSSRERGWHPVDPAGGGEVYALYVHPDRWGAGIGRRLLDAAVSELVAAGHTPIRVWALTGNHRALRFYRAHGFVSDGASQMITVGQREKLTLPEERLTLGGDVPDASG